ncbi:hypothetical protein [Streptomyces sp. NRRL F-5123]|uniref:hypothetical protein n=1 Tax=Streptomyces sp. NRRL F-5123 TaxID=1463856 RepID=UPI0004E0E823|nr:hypothetical protein [Streptomyces sp. NRRL F-5123]
MTWGYASLIAFAVTLVVWVVADHFGRPTYEALTTSVVSGFTVLAFCAAQIPHSTAAENAHTPSTRQASRVYVAVSGQVSSVTSARLRKQARL